MGKNKRTEDGMDNICRRKNVYDMNQMVENKVYCPYCGKTLLRMFNGVAELECSKCKSLYKIIVTVEEYTILSVISKVRK